MDAFFNSFCSCYWFDIVALSFPDEIAQSNYQDDDNDAVEFAAGIVSNALTAIDFLR